MVLVVLPVLVGSVCASPPAASAHSVQEAPPAVDIDAYVRNLYRFILRRPSDDAGREYWKGRIQAGASLDAVGQLFAVQREARRVAVRDLYGSFLDRDADPAGEGYWVRRLEAGMPFDDVVATFTASDEHFVARNRNVSQVVRGFYMHWFFKPGDEPGVNYWTSRILTSGNTPAVKRSIALKFFARTAQAADRTTRITTVFPVCGTDPSPEVAEVIRQRYVTTHADRARLAATALALSCPESTWPPGSTPS